MIFFTDKTMTVINNGNTEIVDLTTDLGKECLQLYQKGKFEEISTVIEQSKLIGGNVQESENGKLLVDGVEMDLELANKVREFKKNDVPFDYLIKLAQRINDISSFNVRKQLYSFLSHNGHPITKDGNFIAYKKVREDYRDLHSGQFDNTVGNVVEMPRSQVDDNPNNTCSSGLHVASFDYAKDFGSGRLLIVEVAPEDVVSVPTDYDNMKMRTCRYKVIGETKESIDTVRHGGDDPSYIEEGDIIIIDDMEYQVTNVNRIDGGVVIDADDLTWGECLFNYDMTEVEFYFT